MTTQDFITLKLPQRFDLTPTGKLVFERPSIHSKPYFDNVEYSLNIQFNLDGQVELHYYGEDDTYITLEGFLKLIKRQNPKS